MIWFLLLLLSTDLNPEEEKIFDEEDEELPSEPQQIPTFQGES